MKLQNSNPNGGDFSLDVLSNLSIEKDGESKEYCIVQGKANMLGSLKSWIQKEWIQREDRETICQYFKSYFNKFYYSMNFYHLYTNEMLGTKIRYTLKFKTEVLFSKNTGRNSVEKNTKGYKKRNQSHHLAD